MILHIEAQRRADHSNVDVNVLDEDARYNDLTPRAAHFPIYTLLCCTVGVTALTWLCFGTALPVSCLSQACPADTGGGNGGGSGAAATGVTELFPSSLTLFRTLQPIIVGKSFPDEAYYHRYRLWMCEDGKNFYRTLAAIAV